MIGKTISHYRIEEMLGEGGMGVVYKAEDLKLKRTVALKFLASKALEDEEKKTRFFHEAQAAAALNHPNICTIYEIDEVDGQAFIAMEYIEGKNLKAIIKDKPPKVLNLREVLDYAIQIAEGLHEAHEQGIFHRDIKSTNIMVTKKGQVKIMDFGLAKSTRWKDISKSSSVFGTVMYMSPEQVRGEKVDGRTDIWSFGVVLYEMITGKLPFSGETELAVAFAILDDIVEPLAASGDTVTAQLEAILKRALAKNLDERYQSVSEILIDLKQLGKGIETPDEIYRPAKTTLPKVQNLRKDFVKKVLIPVGLIMVLLVSWLLFRPHFTEKKLNSGRIPIAVISFKNQTGDKAYDYLQEVIPNLLITSLEQSPYLQVTSWQRLKDLLKQIAKEDVEVIDEKFGFELCRKEGVNYIVLGCFTKAGEIFVTDVKLLDVKSKQLLKGYSTRGEGIASILQHQIDELSREIMLFSGISERDMKATQLPIAEVGMSSLDAYCYFSRGLSEYERGYFNEAKKFLEKALAIDSTFAIAYHFMALTYSGMGNYTARDAAVRRAKAYANKATEKQRLYIEALYSSTIEKNQEKVIEILKQMTDKYPTEKRVHMSLGGTYYCSYLYNEALMEFNRALELDPKYISAACLTAMTYLKLKNYKRALEYLEKYKALSPGDADPLNCMGDLFYDMGNLDQAILKYREAIEIKPDFFMLFQKIHYMYALKESYSETMAWVDRFIDVAPSATIRFRGYFWKGFYYYWLGDLNGFMINFQQAEDLIESEVIKELGIDKINWYKSLLDWWNGWIYYDRNELEQSKKYHEQASRGFKDYFPDNVAFHNATTSFVMGLLDLKAARIDSAKSRLSEMKSSINEMNPYAKNEVTFYERLPYFKDWATCYYHLLNGKILVAENQYNEAIAVFKNSAYWGPPALEYAADLVSYNLPVLQDDLAQAYLQNGEINKAIAEYERLIKFDPASKDRRLIHPKYHYRLARLYEQKGRTDKGIREYKRFLDIWKDADKDLPEVIDAKFRLAGLLNYKSKAPNSE